MTASENNTVTYDAIHSITDAAGNNWSLIEGRIYLNGVVDPTVSDVVMLAYENGQIWQEGADGTWHAKTEPSDPWGPAAGNPVSVTDTKTWIANSPIDGQNFYDPENWGGGFSPKPGDTAVMEVGAPVIDAALGIQSVGADGLTMVLGTPVVGHSTTLTVKGDITFAQAMTLETPGADASGTVNVAGGTLTNDSHILANDTDNLGISLSSGSFVNNGVLQEDGAHGTLGVYGTGTITNNGSVLVNGGVLELDKQVNGTGSLEIDGGGLLKFGNAVGAGEVITINNGMLDFCAVLTTNPGMQFLGTIAFAGLPGAREQIQINSTWAGDANNSVTLTNIQPGLADLSVYENDVKVMGATLSGHYDASEFSLSHAAANVILTFTPHALTDAVPHS